MTKPEYKVGDLPPEGYMAQAEWAVAQIQGGLHQFMCAECHKWLFPQEVAGHKCTKGETDD